MDEANNKVTDSSESENEASSSSESESEEQRVSTKYGLIMWCVRISAATLNFPLTGRHTLRTKVDVVC